MTVYPPVSVFLGDCGECQLELDGGELAEGSLASPAVVGVLDPHEDRVGERVEGLHGGVVAGRRDPAHRPGEVVRLEHRHEGFYALWVLEATSGMRRCELAGAERDRLDLDRGTLAIETTRVVVNGKVVESDGKTENAQRVIALDPFTLAALRVLVDQLDFERAEFGPDYQDHGLLFC